MQCQLWKHRTFTPARTAATRDARICTRPGRRQNPGPGRKNNKEARTVHEQGDAEKRSTTTTRPGLPHGGPSRAEPTDQGQRSGEEGYARATQREAEEEHNPRVANATGGEEQPDCDPIQACATHGEAREHIGIPATSNAHPDCPEAIVDNTRQEEGELEHLGRLQGEGCRCLANQRERESRIYIIHRPGRRQQSA